MSKNQKKNEKIQLDRRSHGIVYGRYTFMIDGYIDDYSLETKSSKCYLDLIDRKGYVDSDGKIWIYKETREEARKLSPIPWFTTKIEDGNVEYEFSPRYPQTDKIFEISKIGSLTNDRIYRTINPEEKLYDEEVLNELNSSTTIFTPEIREKDDCLKRMIKTIILKKAVNIAKYIPLFPKKYVLSNLKQGLTNNSKMAASTFVQWAEMLGVKFHIIVEDNGKDTDPLKEVLHYDNYTDTIKVIKSLDEVKLLKEDKK